MYKEKEHIHSEQSPCLTYIKENAFLDYIIKNAYTETISV